MKCKICKKEYIPMKEFDEDGNVCSWAKDCECNELVSENTQLMQSPVTSCGNCKYYKPDYELSGLGSCKNTEVMGNRIILKYCGEFYLAEDFGCTRFESKSV